jgi:hypothetical protein
MMTGQGTETTIRSALARRANSIDPEIPEWPPPAPASALAESPSNPNRWMLAAAIAVLFGVGATAVALRDRPDQVVDTAQASTTAQVQSTLSPPPTTEPVNSTLPAAPGTPPPELHLGYVPEGWQPQNAQSTPPDLGMVVLVPTDRSTPPAETDFRRVTLTVSRYEFPATVRAALDAADGSALSEAWRAHVGPADGVDTSTVHPELLNGALAVRVVTVTSPSASGAAAADRTSTAVVTFPGRDLVLQVTGEGLAGAETIRIAEAVTLE